MKNLLIIVFKHSKTDKNSLLVSSKTDSTNLNKTDSGSKTKTDWYKETINFLPGRDTNVYHFNTTTPVNNYYPAQIIREGGSMTRDEWLRITDSMNRRKTDTTANVQSKSETTTKVKVLSSAFQIVGLCALVFLVLTVMSKINFTQLFKKKAS
jgi:hypothetical protein